MSKEYCEKKCINLPNKFKNTEHNKNQTSAVDKCSQPKLTGNCFAIIPKYFFNSSSQKCEEFNYG